MAHTYAKTQTHTDRCEANSFPWWKLCRYLWDILGIWHVVRGKKCVCVVLLSAIQNSKVNSKNSIYVFVWLHVHRCMNASVVAALLNDNLATLLQVCVRVLMHTGAMCADFFYSCTRSRCLITWRVQINERLRGACFLSRPLYCTDKHEPLGFSTAAWLQKPRVIHSTFLKVRSVLDTWRHNTVGTTGRVSFQYHLFLISVTFYLQQQSLGHQNSYLSLNFSVKSDDRYFSLSSWFYWMKWSIWSYPVSM